MYPGCVSRVACKGGGVLKVAGGSHLRLSKMVDRHNIWPGAAQKFISGPFRELHVTGLPAADTTTMQPCTMS